MAIPNTTPTPNELYNGEMKKMNDTELRVVLIVTRATLGWEVNHETGMRKQEDWISHTQLIEKSGRSSRAVSMAVDNCVKSGWIETRTQEGKILDTAEKRKKHGTKIYYRLGRIFLDKIETIATNAKVDKPSQSTTETIATNDTKPSQKVRTTKETITKETIQKNRLDKPTVRKNITFENDDYKKVIASYEKLKGIKLQGQEYSPVQQDIKTMFLSGRKPEEIIRFMEWFNDKSDSGEKEYVWTVNWTIKTVRLKIAEFLAGKLGDSDEEIDIPEYAKQFQGR